MPSIAVVGAGVVGLSTAVCLQQHLPDVTVTVVADKFTTATTSDGAAGIFRATEVKVPGIHPDRLRSVTENLRLSWWQVDRHWCHHRLS